MILIILFIVAVTGILVYLLLARNRKSVLEQTGTIADAVILNIHLTGICVKDSIQAIIQLQVKPERGKSFVCEIKEMLHADDYTQLLPGVKITVKFNPRNQKAVLVAKETFKRAFNNVEVI